MTPPLVAPLLILISGMVSEFQVATTTPDLNGGFRVDIPDFSPDTSSARYKNEASLGLTLRDWKTPDPIALNLSP